MLAPLEVAMFLLEGVLMLPDGSVNEENATWLQKLRAKNIYVLIVTRNEDADTAQAWILSNRIDASSLVVFNPKEDNYVDFVMRLHHFLQDPSSEPDEPTFCLTYAVDTDPEAISALSQLGVRNVTLYTSETDVLFDAIPESNRTVH